MQRTKVVRCLEMQHRVQHPDDQLCFGPQLAITFESVQVDHIAGASVASPDVSTGQKRDRGVKSDSRRSGAPERNSPSQYNKHRAVTSQSKVDVVPDMSKPMMAKSSKN